MAKKTHEQLADIFAKRFEDYNTKVIEDIAGIIKQFNGLTYTQAHKLAQQLRFNKSYKQLVDELSKLSNKSAKEVELILEQAVKENVEFQEVFFKAKNIDKPVYEEDKTLQNIVNAVSKASTEDFINISKSTGFTFLDKDNHIKFLNMKETYQKVIDECVYAVSTGKDSFNNVMRNTINQLTESGVRRIVYANDGKKQYSQRIDTAVRRNIMDSLRAINLESNKEIGERFDYDGVEISVHIAPAPDHALVQGHQFRLEEFNKFQNDEDCKDVNGKEYPAISDETGRDRRSIGQYNCYHNIIPIIVGITRPLYTDEQLQKIIDDNNKGIEIDGKHYTLYEATQLQRRIETEIRKSKDAHIMYKTTDDRLGMLKEQKRITQLTQKYNKIVKKGLPNQIKRATVSGYRPTIRNIKEIEYARKNNKIYHTTAYTEDIIKSKKLEPSSIAVGKKIVDNVKYGTQYVVFKPEILSEITKKDILFKGDGGTQEQNSKRFNNLMDMLKNNPKIYNELKTKKDIDIIQYIDYIKLRDDEPKSLYRLLEKNNIKYEIYKDDRFDIFREDRKIKKKR